MHAARPRPVSNRGPREAQARRRRPKSESEEDDVSEPEDVDMASEEEQSTKELEPELWQGAGALEEDGFNVQGGFAGGALVYRVRCTVYC